MKGFETRFPAVAFDGNHQRSRFAADKGACAETNLNIKVQSLAKDIFTQKPILVRLRDCDLETFHRRRILRAYIDIAGLCADRVSRNRHRFQNRMRIVLQN